LHFIRSDTSAGDIPALTFAGMRRRSIDAPLDPAKHGFDLAAGVATTDQIVESHVDILTEPASIVAFVIFTAAASRAMPTVSASGAAFRSREHR
jgi:hypothetical protein